MVGKRILGVSCDWNWPDTGGDNSAEHILVSSTEAGLRRLGAEDFDVIYVDHQRIELDEIEFLQRVRKRDSEIPVLTFTGDAPERIGAKISDEEQRTRSEKVSAPYARYSNDALEAWIETEDTVPNFVNLLESLFEHVPVHLFIKDPEGRHLWTSSSFYDETDQWIGKRDSEVDNDASDEFATKAYEDDRYVLESGDSLVDIEEYDSSRSQPVVCSYAVQGAIHYLLDPSLSSSEKEAAISFQN